MVLLYPVESIALQILRQLDGYHLSLVSKKDESETLCITTVIVAEIYTRCTVLSPVVNSVHTLV
jgi:hypothetical protein